MSTAGGALVWSVAVCRGQRGGEVARTRKRGATGGVLRGTGRDRRRETGVSGDGQGAGSEAGLKRPKAPSFPYSL